VAGDDVDDHGRANLDAARAVSDGGAVEAHHRAVVGGDCADAPRSSNSVTARTISARSWRGAIRGCRTLRHHGARESRC
jgi:hypothetical protein